MADAPLTFTPEQFAAQCDDLQRRLDAGDYGDDDDGLISYLIALLDFAASTLRRLSAVEGQRCETCVFAGKPDVSAKDPTVGMRMCRHLFTTVPLSGCDGPFGCNRWQPHPAQETR